MGTPRFTLEFKEEAVSQIIERGYSVADVSVRLGVSQQLKSRVEYSHNVNSTSQSKLGYADTQDHAYTATVLGLSENTLSASAGVDFTLLQGLTMGLSYQGMLATSDGARGYGLIYRINAKF